jgi:flagellar basal-body rod protein FlgB
VTVEVLDSTTRLLTAALQVLGRRHAVLAANIANVETPGYRRADVDFASALHATLEARQAGEALGEGGLGSLEAFVLPDGGEVDVELEMAEITRNSLQMMALSALVALKLDLMRSAISEGRR